ncbi:MAG TPA: farnesyl diphosphate synthase [Aestuariivirgaceae bacterium]|nr:farnesyl diphosphate synthase [Aestuariivirgaceae bacterium]
MSFEEALARRGAAVGAFLEAAFASRPPRAPRLDEAMRYAALGPGKRIRPYLLIESAALFGVAEVEALPAAAALECVHCYSLVHDDLPAMDDDDMRRGRPTAHLAFDEATAILAGDALLTFAFELLAVPTGSVDAETRTALVLALARAAGAEGMAGGQALDIAAGGAPSPDPSRILELQALKTGALFGFAVEAGAILGDADGDTRDALRRYGEKFGLAFQVADDLIDRLVSSADAGKRTGKDADRGKATLVDLYGIDGAKREARALSEAAIAALAPFAARAAPLVDAARFVLSRIP